MTAGEFFNLNCFIKFVTGMFNTVQSCPFSRRTLGSTSRQLSGAMDVCALASTIKTDPVPAALIPDVAFNRFPGKYVLLRYIVATHTSSKDSPTPLHPRQQLPSLFLRQLKGPEL